MKSCLPWASACGGSPTDRPRWLADAATPAALTGVAATAVIGGGVAALGWTRTAWMLLAVAGLLWAALIPRVLRHWQVPTVGGSFLICVATEALAVLAATLARATGSRPAVYAGSAAFLLGLVLYAVVLARFDWHQLTVGAGDQWVVAGALAISSLAGAQLVLAGDRLGLLGRVRGQLRDLDVGLWALALAGYAVLLVCELRWPRWRYDVPALGHGLPHGHDRRRQLRRRRGRATARPRRSGVRPPVARTGSLGADRGGWDGLLSARPAWPT